MLHSYDCWWLLKEPAVMCGSWNVRQATSQQLFKMTTFCTDTRFQSFSPLINCIVHHALRKFSTCRNKTLPQRPQLVRIANFDNALLQNAPDSVIYRVEGRTVGWPCQDWLTGVSHGTEARLCQEHDVLAHCLAGRQTCLQQCCGSLVALSAPATRLGNTAVDFYSKLNEDELGTAEFGYCKTHKSACIGYQFAIRTSFGSELLR